MTTLTWDLVKKKKNHLHGAWSNVSLDTAHLQEQVTITSQAHLQATPASEILTKMEDSFQKLNPLSVIKGFGGGSLWGTRVLMPFAFHSSQSADSASDHMRESPETHLLLITMALQSRQKGDDVAAWRSRDQNLPHDWRVQRTAPCDCPSKQAEGTCSLLRVTACPCLCLHGNKPRCS